MPIKRPISPGRANGNTNNYVVRRETSRDRPSGFQNNVAIPAFVPKPLQPRPILPTPNQIKYQVWDRQSQFENTPSGATPDVTSGASSDDASSQSSMTSPLFTGQASPLSSIPPMTHFDHNPTKKKAEPKEKEKESSNATQTSGRKRGISEDELSAAMTLSTCFQNH